MRLEASPHDSKLLAQQGSILASDPDNVVANCNKGIILLDLCRSEALECFERALRRDSSCARAWIGKGRVLTLQEYYDGAEECFGKVPKDDADYSEAQRQSARNMRYRDRRGHAQAGVESGAEKNFNDDLERWMCTHLNDIRNLDVLLHKFQHSKDGQRRKVGNVFHASLVRRFYEYGDPLKVVAVECKNTIEPDTDIDIVLSGDVYIQVWHGKMPLGYTIDGQLWSGNVTPLDMDWCEELKPVEKKLKQLPSNSGKGFVINFAPGTVAPPPPPLHHLCDERKCVMNMMAFNDNPHIIVTGTSDFRYRDEACQIAKVLERPVRFILGDWDELREQGRNPMLESAYGCDPHRTPYADLIRMQHSKQDLLSYAKNILKHPACDDLAKLGREELYMRLWETQLLNDSDCQGQDE